MVLRQLNIYSKKWGWTPISYHIQNSQKWIKDLNVRAETIKLLEENIGVSFHDLESGNGFLNMKHKAQAAKEKNRQIGFNQN